MHKRWYDKDPAVSLAVSLMRNSSIEEQYKYAEFIINRAKELGVTLEESPLANAFNFVKRWYDNDKQLAEAFEYLQKASVEYQKEIALDLIHLIQDS